MMRMVDTGSPVQPFKLIAGHAALDFVNTLDDRFSSTGPQELLTSYSRLLDFSQQAGLLTRKQISSLSKAGNHREQSRVLRSAIALRETLAEVVYALVEGQEPKRDDLAKLERTTRTAEVHRRLAYERDKFVWQWQDLAESVEAPLWLLAHASSDLLVSADSASIRACDAQTCRWLFLDTSKNHARRWCDMKVCGNRMKAWRYHQRHGNKSETAAGQLSGDSL